MSRQRSFPQGSATGSDDSAAIAALSASVSSGLATKADRDAYDRGAPSHTGSTPASNVLLQSGETVEAAIRRILQIIATPGASAPSITSDPTISDTTPTVGDTLTATPGTVTEGSGGSHTNEWQWYKTDASGTVAIDGATATTLFVSADLYQFGLTVTQIAVDSLGLRSLPRTSALTTAVAGTAPTNSVAPSISPTGTQSPSTLLTASVGTWTGASTYGIQWYANGVPVGSRSATTTLTPGDLYAGQNITIDVIAYSSLSVPSATAVAGSNTVVLSGAAALTVVSSPAWPTNVYSATSNTITPTVWSDAGYTGRIFDYYKVGSATPYRSANTSLTHTPQPAPHSDNVSVGDSIYFIESVTFNGSVYQAVSNTKTVQAAPATLVVTTQTATVSVTAGQAVTAFTPVTYTGGVAPVNASISPALPSGLSMSSSGQITGTPSTAQGATTYTVTFTDSTTPTAQTDSDTFSLTVQAAALTGVFALLEPANTFTSYGSYPTAVCPNSATMASSITSYTTSTAFSSISESTGILWHDGQPRLRKTTSGGFSIFEFAHEAEDPTHFSGVRSEADFFASSGTNVFPYGEEFWQAMCFRLPDRAAGDPSKLIWQWHQSGSTVNPFFSLSQNGSNLQAQIRYNANTSPTQSTNVVFTSNIAAFPSVSSWITIVINAKCHHDLAQNPFMRIWMNGTSLIDRTGTDGRCGYNQTSTRFHRVGFYAWQGMTAGTRRLMEVRRMVAARGTYSEAQLRAYVEA